MDEGGVLQAVVDIGNDRGHGGEKNVLRFGKWAPWSSVSTFYNKFFQMMDRFMIIIRFSWLLS